MARAQEISQGRHSAQRARSSSDAAQKSAFDGPREVAFPRLVLVLCVFILTVLGLVMVFSSSSIVAIDEGVSPLSYVGKQLAIALVSVLICFLIARFLPYYVWLGPLLWV